jgi:hypothetical protein
MADELKVRGTGVHDASVTREPIACLAPAPIDEERAPQIAFPLAAARISKRRPLVFSPSREEPAPRERAAVSARTRPTRFTATSARVPRSSHPPDASHDRLTLPSPTRLANDLDVDRRSSSFVFRD